MTEHTDTENTERGEPNEQTVEEQAIEASDPEEFGLVQVWWGDGKGKTTAALGMGFRAAGHGYRTHVLQFMKGGAGTVEDVRGEYNAITTMPGISYENAGHYGWHGRLDDSSDDDHESEAQAGLERAKELVEAAGDSKLGSQFPLDGPPEDGVHMLILDEILYAANRGLVDPEDVLDLVAMKPDNLELVLTGSHDKPAYIYDHADLVTEVGKAKHPIEQGQGARRGTEY
jgi:cob(I)alamin adenosyltransferase